MEETAGRLGTARIAAIVGLAALTLGAFLGGSGRLTYHEAIWARAAAEMIDRGDPIVPTIDGRPWLEKPPTGLWLIAAIGKLVGRVDETVARAPSAASAALLAIGTAVLASRRFGPTVGLLAGLVQATTVWLVARGRLAESDILLACLTTWGMTAFDQVRMGRLRWRWAFFGLVAASAMVKGIGFGAVLLLATVAVVLIWDRDRATLRALTTPTSLAGWALAAALASSWPILALLREPQALGLWTLHVSDRLAARPEHFIGEPLREYALSPFWNLLPWTPVALMGAWRSRRRILAGRGGPERLLLAWAIVPAALVSLATVKNAHYLIYAFPPWSIWSALRLVELGERLRARGWPAQRLGRLAVAGFAALGIACALGHGLLGPRLDRRGREWAFYQEAARRLDPGEPLALLYDEDDRAPYDTPFGPFPHDLPVRLFYLDRPACWRQGVADLADRAPAPRDAPFGVIGRQKDVPALRRLGRVEAIARGPTSNPERAFILFRIVPETRTAARTGLR